MARWLVPVMALAMVAAGGCGGTTTPAGDDGVATPDLPDTAQADGTDTATPDDGRDTTPPEDPGTLDATEVPPADPGCSDCDVPPVDVPPVDVPPSCPGGYLCACTSNDDCLSDLCVQDATGMVCSRACSGEDSCPEGWKCSQMTGTGGDVIFLCVNPFSTLCRPCKTDPECVPPEGAGTDRYACLPRGVEGSFCGRGCATAADCPGGYGCEDVTAGRATAKFCVPTGGAECACPAYFEEKGFKTTCRVSNEIGTCTADRTCGQECGAATPAAETCNGTDDDCDSQTDEGVSGLACPITNEFGTCTGLSACNDGKPACNGQTPKAESCNGADDDCDGTTDEEDAAECTVFHRDEDLDRFGRIDDHKCLCAAKGAYTATVGNDCDDTKAAVNPGATEVCNGVDDNCDGSTDPAGAANCTKVWRDDDQDTYGVTGTDTCLCAPAAPFSAIRDGDCADGDGTVYPGAPETCNGKDDNCNASTDEAGAADCVKYYRDQDRDTFGVLSEMQCTCAPVGLFDATAYGDCNDSNADIRPGATESCNGVDDDCDGLTDEIGAAGCAPLYYDNDGDGTGIESDSKCLCKADGKYSAPNFGDCNDTDGAIHPGATETCDGKDNDCNGGIDEDGSQGCGTLYLDADGDTWGAIGSARCLCSSQVPPGYTATRGEDCNDLDGNVNPSKSESCTTVGVDDNCNGQADEAGASGCTTYFRDQDVDTFGSQTESRCLCVPSGDYSATRSGDCCDTDDRAKPGQETYYATANNCGSYDYNCSTAPDKEPFPTGGRCTGWSIGSGCNLEQGWEGASAPACGASANYVYDGCGYCCFGWTCCCDPTRESRIQKCR